MIKRIDWVDIFRSVAIIAIVIGHSGSPTPIKNLMYAFHLPAFFFISGYMFNQQKEFFVLVKDSFRRLLFPYFSFAFLFIGLHAVLRFLNYETLFYENTTNEITSPLFILKAVLTVSYLDPLSGVIWFLWLFFETTLFSAVILKIFQKYRISYLFLCLPVIVLFLFGVIIIYPRFPATEWPYFLDINFATVPFFLLGFLVRYYEVFRRKRFLLCLSPLMMIVLFFLAWKHNAAVDYNWRSFDNWHYFLPSSLSAFVCIFCFSIFADKIGWLKKIFTFIGERTLSIMCLHPFAFKVVFIFLVWLGVSPIEVMACFLPPPTTYFWVIMTLLSISISLVLSKMFESNRYLSYFFLGIHEPGKKQF